MKEQDIKNLGFNEEITKILLEINKADIEEFKGFMYSLEHSKREYANYKHKQQFTRDVFENNVEKITINFNFNEGTFNFQIVEFKNGKMVDYDESYLSITPEKKSAELKTPTRSVEYSYEDGKFVEKTPEKVM